MVVTFAVNHLAPFLLTTLLLGRLKESAPARIVTVASMTHSVATIDFDDLQGERKYSGAGAYNQSKLANIMFTCELARRLEGTGVTATSLHPGVVRTNLGGDEVPQLFKVVSILGRPFTKSPAQGARTSVYLATSPKAEGVTGGYFVNSKPATPGRNSRDEAAAARLWQVSEQLVSQSAAVA